MTGHTSEWHLVQMSELQAMEVSGWRYPAPFDIYDWQDWVEMVKSEREFGDPAVREQQYYVCVDNWDNVSGYVQLFPMEGVTRIGLGLSPQLCGKGLGRLIVELAVQEAMARQANSEKTALTSSEQLPELEATASEIDLEVLTWNERAIRVYQRCGFAITDTYERMTPSGMAKVHCMVYMGKM